MNNTNQHLAAIYDNIHSFYEYRGHYPLAQKQSQDSFVKTIQKDKYVILPSVHKSLVQNDSGEIDKQKLENVENERLLVVILVYPGTECENKKINMMKMLNKIQYKFADVLIITQAKVSAGVAKGLKAIAINTKNNYRQYKAFTYTLFNSVLPEHDLVPKYKILDKDQIEQLRNWNIDPNTLPKIFENDPQMIWLGAVVGDVVQFIMPSEVTIESIQYCIVISSV